MQQGTIYRVLVASPSDCVQERQLVPDVIYAWNASHSLPFGAILEPVMWETHARPELGDRPQAVINKQLVDNCDILVGTFRTRLGTNTGKAESGTAEEIEEFRDKGKPVFLYFSSVPAVQESSDQTQYQALLQYKEKLGQEGLYFCYESLDKLRQLLQGHLASIMAQLHVNSGLSVPTSNKVIWQTNHLVEFRAQFESFLRRFEAEWVSERDSRPHNINVGQRILANALEQLLSFRSQIIAGMESVAEIIDDVSKELRGMQRYQVVLDGGESFCQFWSIGDSVIEKLKGVPACIEEVKNVQL